MPSSSRFGSDSDIPYGQQNEGIDSESVRNKELLNSAFIDVLGEV